LVALFQVETVNLDKLSASVANDPVMGASALPPLAQIEQAQTFGFGPAVPGQRHPTVFVYGTIEGERDRAVSIR